MMQTQYPNNIPTQTRRGRPCKPSIPTSADTAQNRRKQVREAQRSYRYRQQSHVESLKARVAQLEDVVGQLGQVVNTFNDQIIKHSALLSRSKLVKSVSLLKEETDEHLKQAEGCTVFQGSEFQGKIARVFSEPSSSNGCESESTADGSSSSVVQSPSDGLLKSDFWRLFFSSGSSILPPIQETSPTIPYPLHDTTVEAIHYATTPFTQRLFRACTESGYGYLTDFSVSDAQMCREFGLQLQSLRREEIIYYFDRARRMNPCNPFKDPRVPFISLGGAGTHFQSVSTGGVSVPQPPVVSSLLLFQKTNGVRVVPSEEQWFDVRDVEGYLVANGIKFGCYGSALYTAGGAALSSSSGQMTPTNIVPVIDESALIKVLSLICISLGCSAGFLRQDVESLVWQNVTWELV